MNSWHEFIFMGKHGAYVWSSYFMTLIVLLGLFFGFRMMMKSLRKGIIEQAKQPASDKPKARKLNISKSE